MGYAIGAVLAGSSEDPCCCTPDNCCLYPWPDSNGEMGGPFYPDTDLPDTVLLDGIPMTRSGYQYLGSGFPPAPSGSTDRVIDSTSLEYWNIYDGLGNELQVLGNCLIVDLGTTVVEDEFPDSLVMSFAGYDTTVNRVSLCLWEGADICGNIWQVWYGDLGGIGGTDYKWSALAYQFDFGDGPDCDLSEGFPPTVKSDPQSSPVGTYDVGIITVIVS